MKTEKSLVTLYDKFMLLAGGSATEVENAKEVLGLGDKTLVLT